MSLIFLVWCSPTAAGGEMLRREVTRHSGVVQTMDDRSDDMNEIKTNPTWFVCCDSRRSGDIARERFPRIINTLLQPGRIYSYVSRY